MRPALTYLLLLAGMATVTLPAADASAFCGFYVASGSAKLFNDATQVAMVRHGTRTVLSIQNNYEGPPKDFAMVVPVPQVLHEENVKTLDKDIFDRLDQLSAPRLVELWQKDPCGRRRRLLSLHMHRAPGSAPPPSPAVHVEAKFSVGEYDVVVLSTEESSALDTWLHQHHYHIPQGAGAYFRPYVESGSFFFVAKVDAKKVAWQNGRAVLSPLRFAYDSESFKLPIRLGMLNSHGEQDLIVYILASERYEVANYPNVTIPTNIEVNDRVRDEFTTFYSSLFDRTLESKKTNDGRRAVVTEYAWEAKSCDPCVTPPLSPVELVTLGADDTAGWVLTRLHTRYGPDEIGEDLVFRSAPAITGGREGQEDGAHDADVNNFQGRYVIRHAWRGPISCDDPDFARWGGPPTGGSPLLSGASSANTRAAAPNLKPDRVDLARAIDQKIPGMDLGHSPGKPARRSPFSCKGCATTPSGSTIPGLLLLGLLVLGRFTRRSRRNH